MQLISVLCSNDIRCAAFRVGRGSWTGVRRHHRSTTAWQARIFQVVKTPLNCQRQSAPLLWHPLLPLICHDHSTSGNCLAQPKERERERWHRSGGAAIVAVVNSAMRRAPQLMSGTGRGPTLHSIRLPTTPPHPPCLWALINLYVFISI